MTIIRRKRTRRPIRATRSQSKNFPFDISEWDLEAYDDLREIFESAVKRACGEALEYAMKDEQVLCFLTEEREYGMAIELPLGTDNGPYWTIDLRDVFYPEMTEDWADWTDEDPELVKKWRDFFAEAAERLTKVLDR